VEIDVIIKIPQGSRNKYEMDAGSGRIRLDRTLHLDPLPGRLWAHRRYAGRGRESLDALVLLGEPAFPGNQLRGQAGVRARSGVQACPARASRMACMGGTALSLMVIR
jgi:inorganic pyrophosphatase